MMKMDCRDRAEFQNWEKRDINVIFRKAFKPLDDKKLNSVVFFIKSKGKKGENKTGENQKLAVAENGRISL